jgi:hypothetical protein
VPCGPTAAADARGDILESGWASDEWQLDDADLLEVLAWADSDDSHRRSSSMPAVPTAEIQD